MVSSRRLILRYTIQQVIHNICTRFQNLRWSCSWEIFWHKFPHKLHLSERWKNGKRRQKLISASWFSFPQYTWPLLRSIQNLKTLALIEAEKSVTEIFTGEKEKWINKGTDERRRLILSYTIQQIIPNICTKFQNPRCSSSWEIFYEKKFTHTPTQTNKHTQLLKRQILYTPYILRMLGV